MRCGGGDKVRCDGGTEINGMGGVQPKGWCEPHREDMCDMRIELAPAAVSHPGPWECPLGLCLGEGMGSVEVGLGGGLRWSR